MFDTNLTYMEKKYIETSIQKIIKDIASNNDEQIVVDAYNDDIFMRVCAPFLDGKYNMKWMKHHDFGFNESKIKQSITKTFTCFAFSSIMNLESKSNVKRLICVQHLSTSKNKRMLTTFLSTSRSIKKKVFFSILQM